MSDTALATKAPTDFITRDKIYEYLQTFGFTDLTKNETEQFVEIAQAFQLNPFKREIYCVPYGKGDKRKLSIITGYESYLKRAERIGKLRGWKAWTEGSFTIKETKKELQGRDGPYTKTVHLPVGDLVAKIKITREGWIEPFEHEVYLDEYAQDNEMWANKPRTMLKKVCIAQAFRLCFPDEMGGMPYTSDELPDEMGKAPPEELKPAEDQNTEVPPPKRTPEEEAKWALHNEISALIKRLSDYLMDQKFTDADRDKAKKKITIGQSTSPAYRDYVMSLCKEYEAKLEKMRQEASQGNMKPAEDQEVEAPQKEDLFVDDIPEGVF